MNPAPAPDEEAPPFWRGELDYDLPADRIAQHPAARREDSRLLVVDRGAGTLADARFGDIGDHLPAGALLVANDSLVVPARLLGRKRGSGGAVEALLLGGPEGSRSEAMVRAGKALKMGQWIDFDGGPAACVAQAPAGGRVVLDFAPSSAAEAMAAAGQVPLPPYIEREGRPTAEDRERYQTVYAASPGSVAAPTAGLHFSRELLAELGGRGFELATITLHVGPGTFTPVRADMGSHRMEEESYEVPDRVSRQVREARAAGRPVVAVGTTTVRALESAADEKGRVRAGPARSDLFIRPGHRFRVVDALVTNFHLPGSTLLALVMALAGRELAGQAYRHAVARDYRFYSFGDAMLVR